MHERRLLEDDIRRPISEQILSIYECLKLKAQSVSKPSNSTRKYSAAFSTGRSADLDDDVIPEVDILLAVASLTSTREPRDT